MADLQLETPHVVYEDEVLVVVEKPAALHSVSLPQGGGASLADWLRVTVPQAATASEKAEDAGLVHRLDFESCGLLLAAKSRTVWEMLRSGLLSEQISKEYRVIVEGKVAGPAEFFGYIGGRGRHSETMRWSKDKPTTYRALAAHTTFTPEKYFEEHDVTLVRVVADAARRHQVRVHAAKALGHPLVGDSRYGSNRLLPTGLLQTEKFAGAFFLQACKLSFVHPISGEKCEFSARSYFSLTQLCK